MITRRRKPAQKTVRKPGQMRPFTLDQVAMLEALLPQDGSLTALRDLALLRVGIDTMLRSSDVVTLRLRDVMPNGQLTNAFAIKQRKTSKVVQCEISDRTQAALAGWLAINPQFTPEDRVFAITTRQHQRIVKGWCALLKLDGALYSTHSIRRTKPAHLYAKTKNLAACKELLGHANVSATGVYLGVTGDDARALARQFPI
ncbi:MAG: tyrosine-type recombinase/integrase [Rhodomicrobium sp.]